MRAHVPAVAIAALLAGCVAPPPKELQDARLQYAMAEQSAAHELAPVQMQQAKNALHRAEVEYDEHPRTPDVRELAYVAQRRVWIAESEARAETARRQIAEAERQIDEELRRRMAVQPAPPQPQKPTVVIVQHDVPAEPAPQPQPQQQQATSTNSDHRSTDIERDREVIREREVDLDRRAELDAERRMEAERARFDAEERARRAERDARDALDAVKRVGPVHEEGRGLVVTLPGSLLFPSGSAQLLPGARQQLGELARALIRLPDRELVIEGHTDAKGRPAKNEELSFERADAVREFLQSQGVPRERMRVTGYGAQRPIADNRTPDGRASNRRVEVVLVPAAAERGVGGSGYDGRR